MQLQLPEGVGCGLQSAETAKKAVLHDSQHKHGTLLCLHHGGWHPLATARPALEWKGTTQGHEYQEQEFIWGHYGNNLPQISSLPLRKMLGNVHLAPTRFIALQSPPSLVSPKKALKRELPG